MSNPPVRPQAEEEPALIEAAREAANEVLEAATEVERYIEKGTPQFMRTSLALFSGGFATFALLYCIQPMMPVLSKAFSISAAMAGVENTGSAPLPMCSAVSSRVTMRRLFPVKPKTI